MKRRTLWTRLASVEPSVRFWTLLVEELHPNHPGGPRSARPQRGNLLEVRKESATEEREMEPDTKQEEE